MPSPLLTRDGRHLATPSQPAWLRRLLVWSVPLAAAVLLAVNSAGTPDATCTESAPCTADPSGSMLLGLFVASAVVGLVHPATAAALACVFTAGSLGYDVLHPQTASTWWADAALIGYAMVSLATARALRTRPGHDVAFDWLARTPYAMPPAPARLPGPDRRMLALLGLAVIAAGVFFGLGLQRQAEADAQQEAARVVSVEVVGQVDEYTLQVRLPDGTTTRLSMIDTVHHPAGSRLGLRVDAAGLRQPVGEEYDASGWYLPAVLLAALALAGVMRLRQHRHGLYQLFTRPQPVSAVYVCETWDRLAVYPADARPGEPATAEVRLWRDPAQGPPASLLAALRDRDDDDDGPPELQTALLYGVPAPGQWCAIAVDGEVRLPRQPLRARFSAPVFVPPGMSEDEPAGVDLPLRPEELAALASDDRDDDPLVLRRHAGHPLFGYLRIAALAVGLVALARLLPALPIAAALGLCALAAALAAEAGWRLWLRPRLTWNGGGLAVIGMLGARRLAWTEVRHISADRGAVIVAGGESALVVPAGSDLRWPAGAGRRNAQQLALALRHARHRAITSGAADLLAPPPLAVPARPVSLAALWLVLTPLLAAILYLTG
jgi:hypothetical protein